MKDVNLVGDADLYLLIIAICSIVQCCQGCS